MTSIATKANATVSWALPAIRLLSPRRLIALMYHAVAPEAPPVIKHLIDCKSPRAFESDIVFLQNHYRLIGHDEVATHVSGLRRTPERSATVSFDDGLAECHSVVRPILLSHGVPCTFFVVTDLIDNRSLMFRHKVSLCLERLERMSKHEARQACATVARELGAEASTPAELGGWARSLRYRDTATIDGLSTILSVDVERFLRETPPYMTSGEILDLHRDGFTIGAHTRDHPEPWELETEELERQIVESCLAVRDLTGQQAVPFSFPFWGSDVDRATLARVLDEHPWITCLYDSNGLVRDRRFIVNRISADIALDREATDSNLPLILAKTHAIQPLRTLKRAATRATSR